jgi:hypothetical protein
MESPLRAARVRLAMSTPLLDVVALVEIPKPLEDFV